VRVTCVAVLLGLALLIAQQAAAHLSVTPAFLTAGETEELVVTVHNDRDETMTGFELTVPRELRIASIRTAPGWNGGVRDRTATWTGGTLAPNTPASFELAIEAPDVTGPVELEGGQLYPDGEVVEWPLEMTVVPPDGKGEEFSYAGPWLWAVLLLLALATVGFGLFRRRREA
jgi:uncharacterized protein YcnI